MPRGTDNLEPRSICGALGESRDELLAVIRSIYPPAKEQLGVLAIEIQVAGQAPGASPDADAPRRPVA